MTPADRERAIEDIQRKQDSGLYSASQIALLKDAFLDPTASVPGMQDAWGNEVGTLGSISGKSSEDLKQDLARYSPGRGGLEPADSQLTLGRRGVYDHDQTYQASRRLTETGADPDAVMASFDRWAADRSNPLKAQGREYLDSTMLPDPAAGPAVKFRPRG